MFDMGKNYISSIFEIIKDPDNQILLDNIKKADKQKSNFKEKIRFLYKYYLEYIERTKVINLRKTYKKIEAERIKYTIGSISLLKYEMLEEETDQEFLTRKNAQEEQKVQKIKQEYKKKLLEKVKAIENDLNDETPKYFSTRQKNNQKPMRLDTVDQTKAMLEKTARTDQIAKASNSTGNHNLLPRKFPIFPFINPKKFPEIYTQK